MSNNKTRVIKYLLSKERNYNNGKLSVEIGRKTFEQSELSDMGENEFINQLSILETEGFITVHFRTPRRDLACFVTVDLNEPIINYFKNKKAQTTISKREWVRTYIPIIISAIALIKSFDKKIITLCKLLLKLLSQ